MSEKGHKTVKEWSAHNQPRERLERFGASALTDAELLAILLRSGTQKMNVIDCCNALLADNNNNLNNISRLSVQQLSQYEGIGKVKAVTLLAAIELGKRRSLQQWETPQQILSSDDAFRILYPLLCDLDHEEFWVLYLNRKHCIVDQRRISQGGLTGTVADIRLIMRYALETQVTSVILAHNHPSGNAIPSSEDDNLTQKIKNACLTLDIKLIDHIIVAHNLKYSYADADRL